MLIVHGTLGSLHFVCVWFSDSRAKELSGRTSLEATNDNKELLLLCTIHFSTVLPDCNKCVLCDAILIIMITWFLIKGLLTDSVGTMGQGVLISLVNALT